MDRTQIEIVQVVDGPAERVSKTKGTKYWICKVKDGKTGRVGTAFGTWVQGWKLGDVIEAEWKKGPDYQGQEQWGIENPNQATRGGSRGGAVAQSPTVSSYMIAATLLAPTFSEMKKETAIETLTKLAGIVKPLITENAPAPTEAASSTEAKKTTKKAAPKVEEEEEEEEEIPEEEEPEEQLF